MLCSLIHINLLTNSLASRFVQSIIVFVLGPSQAPGGGNDDGSLVVGIKIGAAKLNGANRAVGAAVRIVA